MNNKKYAICLTPALDDKKYLSGIIETLAAEYDAPIFSPHCTLYLPVYDLETARSILNQIVLKQFDVQLLTVSYTDDLWKTVFLVLKTNSQLTTLYNFFDRSFNAMYEFRPHISLIYKKMENKNKLKIKNKLRPPNTYLMDGIDLVDISKSIENWKTVYRIQLDRKS